MHPVVCIVNKVTGGQIYLPYAAVCVEQHSSELCLKVASVMPILQFLRIAVVDSLKYFADTEMFHRSSDSRWWQRKFDITRVRNIPTTLLCDHFWIYTSFRALSLGSGVLSRRAELRSHNSWSAQLVLLPFVTFERPLTRLTDLIGFKFSQFKLET